MLDYVSIDIRLGLAGSRKISPQRIAFHEKTIKLVFGSRNNLTRSGAPRVSPFNYKRINDEPGYIADIINLAVRDATHNDNASIDLLLVDLSSNPFDLLREPILIHLAEALDVVCSKRLCLNFILLLPELPGQQTASIQRLAATSNNNPDSVFIVIGIAGGQYKLPTSFKLPPSFQRAFTKVVKEKMMNPASRFEDKIVRRLGHFRRSRHESGCRLFSYMTDNCEDELLEMLKDWWVKKNMGCNVILYDTRNNPSLTTAVKAFCEYKGLKFYSITDVLTDAKIAAEVKSKQPCLIILDVIETGDTLLDHVVKLQSIGVITHTNVLAAISKAGYKETRIGDFKVSSFALRDRDAQSGSCLQCQLRLPFTSDDEESFSAVRAFDMWFMATKVGWEGETDIPENVGLGYKAVPRFTDMLDEYGDWIAYKMERLYSQLNHPENIFVIHPDELGAAAVSDKLRIRFNNLSIVKVPRPAIKLAQSMNNSWKDALTQLGKEEWVKQLESLSQASALITDIFNASGSTFQSLLQLLRYFNISVFCYFPFVDRDCGPGSLDKYSVPKYSIYQWFGPRQTKRRGADRENHSRRKSGR